MTGGKPRNRRRLVSRRDDWRTCRACRCWRAVAVSAVALLAAATPGRGADQLLLHHGFERALGTVDWAAGEVTVAVSDNVAWREHGVHGRGAGFDMGTRGATLELTLAEPAPANGWTLGFFVEFDDKEVMTRPDGRLLTILDQHGEPLVHLNVSGGVSVVGGDGQRANIGCFDSIYWIEGEKIHLALTYDGDGAATGAPRGKLTAYWSARPYGCAYLDLGDRRPTTMRFGGDDLAVGLDELHLFGTALPDRAVYALARPPHVPAAERGAQLAAIIAAEAERPMAVRQATWRRLAKAGLVIEAEAGRDAQVVADGNALSASGRAYVDAKRETVAIPFEIAAAGDYALALRYALDRRLDPQWPVRNPHAATPWTDNATTVRVRLNGEALSTEHLYPTGTYEGHRGDVEPWAWHALAAAGKVALAAGRHVLEVQPETGLAWPLLDALLVSAEAGPRPPQPRWVDVYRVPPAWWVQSRRTEARGDRRVDTYTVTLRNRADEPYAAAIALEHDMLDPGQSASTDTTHIALAPHEEKAFDIVFETPAAAVALAGYLRVVLWNDDVSLPMEYRLWNIVPEAFHAETPHPRLLPAPDPELQRQFREWLVTREPGELTPELRRWAAGPARAAGSPEYRVLAQRMNLFHRPLLGDRLEVLDMWMGMDEAALEAYLPAGPAEDAGYGTCWNKVANELTGAWHGQTFDFRTEPEAHVWKPDGDLDKVVTLTAKGRDVHAQRERREPIVKEGTWQRDQDPDVFSALRNIRWCMMGGMPYAGMRGVDYPEFAGIPMVAEAYYLTGDEAYAQQAYRMARAFARQYTLKTRQFLFLMHREDRNWWGSRWHNRYMAGMGNRVIQRLGTGVLDLCWNGLTEAQRTVVDHNLVRFGMYEATYGPLWDDPDKGAKVNREDLPPFIPAGLVLGDPGPRRGLRDFFHLVNKMVLSDGIHICSVGSYGGVGTYIGFMRSLHDLGVDVATGNPALRNAFLNHSRFVFSCGSLQPMDDGGGGQNHLGLGALFGMPSRAQYEWGFELYGDPLFEVMTDFLTQVQRECTNPRGADRARRMREFYADNPFPVRDIWPDVFVAEDKGMAMLRNRVADDPLDWIEVLFDYGRFGGRYHGHPTKLSILTAFNGQIGSQDYGDLTRNAPENNNAWFKGGYSHNTVQVDHRPHRTAGGPVQIGELLEAGGDETLPWIDAHSDRMYPGVHMRRTTFVSDAGIVEFTRCASARPRVYDWPYHNFGRAATELTLAPTDVSAQGLLRFAEDARSAAADGLIQVTWKDTPLSTPPRKGQTSLIDETVFARLWALPEAGTELLLFAGPTVTSINEERQIDYAMLRRQTASTVFATVIEPWREATGPKLAAVERLDVTVDGAAVAAIDAYAVKLTRTDGATQVFLVNYSGGRKTVAGVTTDAAVAAWTVGEDGQVRTRHGSAGAVFQTE